MTGRALSAVVEVGAGQLLGERQELKGTERRAQDQRHSGELTVHCLSIVNDGRWRFETGSTTQRNRAPYR